MTDDKWRYFSVKGEDGCECVCHAIVGLEPEGAVAITEAQAAEIDAATTARTKPATPLPQAGSPAFHVDLQPILDRLEAQSKLLAEHAALHDEHVQTAAVTAEKFDQQAQAILDVKAKTAKAIAEALNGLGEKGS